MRPGRNGSNNSATGPSPASPMALSYTPDSTLARHPSASGFLPDFGTRSGVASPGLPRAGSGSPALFTKSFTSAGGSEDGATATAPITIAINSPRSGLSNELGRLGLNTRFGDSPVSPYATGSSSNLNTLNLKMARSVTHQAPSELLFRTQKVQRSSVAGTGTGAGRTIPVSEERCWEYWRKQLRSPAVFTLLTDFPRPVPAPAPATSTPSGVPAW